MSKITKKKKAKRKNPGKGAHFEREICVALSKWISRGAREDIFWRSAMSGGRATVQRKIGKFMNSQAGDISAIDPAGNILTDRFFIELKFYKDLDLHRFWLGEGKLALFWKKASQEAMEYGKEPLLIVRQNFFPTLVLSRVGSGIASHPKISRWHSTGRRVRHTQNIAFALFEEMVKLPYSDFF